MPATTTLIGFYVFSVVSGLMIMEVNINTVCALGSGGVSTQSMVMRTLGPAGAVVSASAFVFLHYGLIVAAISKGGQITNAYSGLPSIAAAAAFAGGTGALCILSPPKLLDNVNTGETAHQSC